MALTAYAKLIGLSGAATCRACRQCHESSWNGRVVYNDMSDETNTNLGKPAMAVCRTPKPFDPILWPGIERLGENHELPVHYSTEKPVEWQPETMLYCTMSPC
jgi:hypothetical protein